MMTAMFGAVESGVIYAIMALGVYLSFRVLDFPDLTVDGSFVTGGAVASILIVNGTNPFLATFAALFAGFLAGCATGVLHTKGGINPLLSGILMMIALYSINLRIMGKPNVPLLAEETVLTKIEAWFASDWGILLFMLVLALIIKWITDLFLKTEVGLSLRAVGDNEGMVRSFSANTGWMKVLGLGLSNALVAFSGALVAQYNGFNDVGMGIGMIVIGLASVIIGEAVIGDSSIARATLAVLVGAVLYRIIVTLALRIEFLDTGDMKLITAIIVIIALILPKVLDKQKAAARKKKRLQQLGGDPVA